MDFDEIVERRFSARKYDGSPVDPDDMERILRAGHMAPTAKNQQREMFVVVDDRELIREMVPLCKNQRWIADAGAIVFACGDGDYTMPNGFSARAVDDAIAISFMMCEAVALGYGTCWLGGYDTDAVRERLNIPERFVVSSALAIGRAVGEGRQKEKGPLSEIVHHNGYSE